MSIIDGLRHEHTQIKQLSRSLEDLLSDPPGVIAQLEDWKFTLIESSNGGYGYVYLLLSGYGDEKFAHKVAGTLNADMVWDTGGYWSIYASAYSYMLLCIHIRPDSSCEIEYADETVHRAIGIKKKPTKV